jgi:hypothetical protein
MLARTIRETVPITPQPSTKAGSIRCLIASQLSEKRRPAVSR